MFRVQLRLATFEGAINAWVALGASEDATARAAARALDSLVWRVVHAAARSSSLAAGAVVAAVARGAASVPVLRLDADAGVVARALAPAVAAEPVSSTFSLKAVSPTPEVVMADAPDSTSAGAALEDVAPAPAAADDSESDDEETLEVMRARVQLRQDDSSSDDDSDGADPHPLEAIAPDADAEDVEEALDAVESEEVAATSSHLAIVEQWLAAEVTDPETFHAGLKASFPNARRFELSLHMLRRHYDDTKLSTFTLRAIFGTDNPSTINAIPLEEFIARVNAKKQDLDLPLRPWPASRPSKSEVAARRAERDAARAEEVERIQALERPRKKQEQAFIDVVKKTQKYHAERAANDGKMPTFQLHAGCPVAFPKKDLPRYLFPHLTAHSRGKNGQGPTPLLKATIYCPSLRACTACEDWVQQLVEENVSVGVPGAGWAHTLDAVLKTAREVRAAFPHITFGGVDLQVPAKVPAKSLEDKLMGLTTGEAAGAIAYALRQCKATGFVGSQMKAAKYKADFVPQFMAHLGLTDIKKVPPRSTLYDIYQAHKRKQTDVAVEPAPPPRSKRARRAPK